MASETRQTSAFRIFSPITTENIETKKEKYKKEQMQHQPLEL